MLQGEHSAILSTFIKLPFVIKIFVLSIFEWPFYIGLLYFIQQRQRPVSRNIRNGSLGGLPGNSNPGNMMNNSPISQTNSSMSQANQLPSPFSSSMTPNKAPISQSTPLSQQHMTSMPPQNGPISVLNGQMPPNMKQFVSGGSGFDSSIASDFSALNLSVPPSSTKVKYSIRHRLRLTFFCVKF